MFEDATPGLDLIDMSAFFLSCLRQSYVIVEIMNILWIPDTRIISSCIIIFQGKAMLLDFNLFISQYRFTWKFQGWQFQLSFIYNSVLDVLCFIVATMHCIANVSFLEAFYILLTFHLVCTCYDMMNHRLLMGYLYSRITGL